MKIVTSKEMKSLDKNTIENEGILGILLMENAGFQCFKFCENKFPNKNKYIICCGMGNNGADGLVIARYLKKENKNVKICFWGDTYKSEEFRINLNIVKNLNIDIVYLKSEQELKNILESFKPDIIVDSILGNGLNSKLDLFYIKTIQELNNFCALKVSVDIPTGVNSDNGEIYKGAFKADYTLSLGTLKWGNIWEDAIEYNGLINNIDIGISKIELQKIKNVLIDDILIKTKIKNKNKNFHKGKNGKAYFIGGNKFMPGAIILAAKSALKSGCGISKVFFEKDVFDTSFIKPQELLWDEIDNKIIQKINEADSILIGPGLGRDEKNKILVNNIIKNSKLPIILDADAINFADKKFEGKDLIYTPHLLEFAKLMNTDVEDVKKNFLNLINRFHQKYDAVLVLKSSTTIISDKNNKFILHNPNAGMGKAGSGDILAGIITSLKAQGYKSIDACIIAVFIHSYAGKMAREKKTEFSMEANDILENIFEGFKILEDKN